MKVKIFDCEHEEDLEELVNNFIEKIEKNDYEVVDIKYSTNVAIYESDQIYIYSALIMYKPKLVLHVEKIVKDSDRVMEAYEKNLERVNGVLL